MTVASLSGYPGEGAANPNAAAPETSREVASAQVAQLDEIVRGLGSVAVAFSGGADSTLLLAVCLQVLGAARVLAVTADSPTLPRSELAEARALAAELGAVHRVIATHELENTHFASNPLDRCYHCKHELFAAIRAHVETGALTHIVYGATLDDLGDYRPGMRAAQEAGAIAPLLQAGFTKAHVRALSQRLGLRTWDKPAMACLSSRFPYGTTLDAQSLNQVEGAEAFLRRDIGLRQVRVRHHAAVARLEVEPSDFALLLDADARQRVVAALQRAGYTYVALDLAGFRSGSMNEAV
jgi:uncharacterized protein